MSMLKIFLLLLYLTLSLSASQLYWRGSYHDALQQARKMEKNLLVYLVKNGEKDCQKIIQKSLMNQAYISRLNEQFVSVIVTYEGRMSYPIEMYYSQIFPTLFFVDSRDERFLAPPLYGKMITPKSIQSVLDE